MVGLIKYDAACSALALARSTDEVKELRDKAEAMRAYARQAKNRELEVDAAEIRLRAERRLGELIQAQKETVGLAKGGQPYQSTGAAKEPVAPTLADAGIDKKLSSRAQKLAAVPEDDFESMVGEWRGRVSKDNERVTTRLLNVGEQARRDANLNKQKLTWPDGKYHVIIIDPPWPIQKIERDVRPNQVGLDYPTMTIEEIEAMDVDSVAAGDCHMFMWATHRFMPDAMDILAEWEFRYVCLFTWHKPGGFQPVGLPQYNSEFIIYARRGSPKFVDTKQFFTCFDAPRREHSRKPDEFYETVARVTQAPRIELFAREQRDGFDVWGNEKGKFRNEFSE